MPSILLDITEFAAHLNVKVKDIKKATRIGQLKIGVHYVQIGDETVYRWHDNFIDEYMKSQCDPPAKPVAKPAVPNVPPSGSWQTKSGLNRDRYKK